MSFPTHLIKINSRFYYKAKVPADLEHLFPNRFIKRSLRTSQLQAAKTMLVSMEYKTHNAFALLRSGILSHEHIQQLVNELIPQKKPVEQNDGILLSKAIDKYVSAKQAEWTAKTKMEVSCVFKLLQDVVGSIDIRSITRPMVLDLRSTLQKLPANLYKRYPGKSIQQILTIKDLDPMSLKSVNKHVARLGALLRHYVDEGVLTSNPASGLKISEKKRADEERSAYNLDDIKKIVNALPRKSATPERYWIPLIGLYSGMRLNEICQLYVSDVIKLDGLWCFSINSENDKRLKNAASERVIPVHPVLVELGLLQYVESLKKSKCPRIWMNLDWTDLTGYGNSFCKWYQRFNRLHVTSDPKKVFHSFRHLVTDTLKQAGVLDTVIAELVGHSNGGSETMGRYGKRYQPKVLLEALMLLDYSMDAYSGLNRLLFRRERDHHSDFKPTTILLNMTKLSKYACL